MTDEQPTRSDAASLPSAERWAALEPMLDAAIALAPNERSVYLDAACGSDRSLRSEIESLLAVLERQSAEPGYLEVPAAARFASVWNEETDQTRFEAAIGEHFRIEGEAGRGGMAVVYRARDLRTDRVVALKVLRATASAAGAARFRREITLAAGLAHPHILPLLDSGECDGRLWYTMPLVAGESLGTLTRRERSVSIARAVRILSEIAEALRWAHERGVVHRDLKPDNILLQDGHAVVADFGVAKALVTAAGGVVGTSSDDIRTATGVGVGTPTYMAPEQAAGEKSVDHRADLYALGVIAYELLAGAPPFTASSRQALMTAHLAERPRPLSAHRRDVPKALEALVMRLLAKQAADRPASAAEVSVVLATLAASHHGGG
jgi:serine/threonine-protein kinase